MSSDKLLSDLNLLFPLPAKVSKQFGCLVQHFQKLANSFGQTKSQAQMTFEALCRKTKEKLPVEREREVWVNIPTLTIIL